MKRQMCVFAAATDCTGGRAAQGDFPEQCSGELVLALFQPEISADDYLMTRRLYGEDDWRRASNIIRSLLGDSALWDRAGRIERQVSRRWLPEGYADGRLARASVSFAADTRR
jgi:hypothetical protein